MATTAPAPARQAGRTRRAAAIVWFFVGVGVLADLVVIVSATTGIVLTDWVRGVRNKQSLDILPQVLYAVVEDGAPAPLSDLGMGARLLCAAPLLIHVVTLLLAGGVIVRIIRGIGDGRPFAAAVLRGWTRLAWVLIVGGAAQGLVDTAAVVMLAGLTAFDDPVLGKDFLAFGLNAPDWPWMLILLGVVAGALAVAFRQGARLEEEVEGVV